MEARIEQNGKLFEANFGELGLQVSYVKGNNTPLGSTYLYNLKNINNYNKKYLNSLIEKIAVFHHLDIKLIDTKEAHFGLFVSEPQETLSLYQLLKATGQRDIVIGKDIYGKNVFIDFDKIPHLLIAGTTGSGKSVLIHNLLVNLMSYYRTSNPNQRFRKPLKLYIIDGKGDELGMYRGMRNTTFVSEPLQAIDLLKQIVNVMDNAYMNGIDNPNDTFIIIDEVADLMLRSKFEMEEALVRLANKGRAMGFHLIISTQRPSVDVVSGLIKNALATRICLKTASVRESCVILDKKGSETLNVGEAIMKNGATWTTFKVAYPEKEIESKFIQCNRG